MSEELALRRRRLKLKLRLAKAKAAQQPTGDVITEGLGDSVQEKFPDEDFTRFHDLQDATPEGATAPEQPVPKRTVGAALFPESTKAAEAAPIQSVMDTETGQMRRFPGKGASPLVQAGEILDAPRKILGAAVNKPEGADFIDALADPNVGLLRQLKENIKNNNPESIRRSAVLMGVEIIEDPLTWATSVVGLANRLGNNALKALANKLRNKQGITLSGQVAKEVGLDRVAKLKGFKGQPASVSEDIVTTSAEKIILEGTDAQKKVAGRVFEQEASIQSKAPQVFEANRQARVKQLEQKVIDLKDKFSQRFGLGADSMDDLAEEAADKVVNASNRFHDEMGKVYDDISKQIDEVGNLDQATTSIVRSEMVKKGLLKQRKTFRKSPVKRPTDALEGLPSEMSVDDFNKLKLAGFGDDAERGLTVALKQETPAINLAEMTAKKTTSVLADEAGVSPLLYKEINKLDELMTKGAKFSDLHTFRQRLDKLWKKANKMDLTPDNEFDVINDMRKAVTEAMEKQLAKASPESVAQFKEANKVYKMNKNMFEKMRNIFAKTEGESLKKLSVESTRTPQHIMKKLAGQPLPEQGRMINQLMRMGLGEVTTPVRNMYFNKIIQAASSKGGKINPEELIRVLNKQNSAVYNTIFTDEMAADIANLVKDAVAVKYANNINLLDKSSKPFLQAMEKLGAIGDWMMRGKAYRAGGIAIMPKLMAAEIGRQTVKNMYKKKAVLEADRYLRPVEAGELPGVFRKAFGYMFSGSKGPVALQVVREGSQSTENPQ